MRKWMEVTVKADKVADDGSLKKVTDKYLFGFDTFTHVEKEAMVELVPLYSGEFEVADMSVRNFAEVLTGDAENYFKAKVELTFLDGDVEKRKAVNVLVQSDSVEKAVQVIKGAMSDYEILIMSKTQYKGVFGI